MPASEIETLLALLPPETVCTDADQLRLYAVDLGPAAEIQLPTAVVRARTVAEVQSTMRWAHETRTPVVCRGAGTGVSGGAHATAGSVVLSLERMNRIIAVNASDETAVVEPGVINADLNAAASEHGLMYAPDPASYRISTLGGNIATNAGGLRCAKYGVTRDSVLALDVVLADGRLISTGHATFKGVAGYDLTGLFVGSEGTLGVVVGATLRLKYLPRDIRTIAAFFPTIQTAAAGVLAVGAARIQPAIMEILDAPTMRELDLQFDSNLAARGAALLLIQTDGFGAEAEADEVRRVLSDLGGTVSTENSAEAERLVELRRHGRGLEKPAEYRVGEDVAVPRSQLVTYIADLDRMAAAHGVQLRVIAHAGDGNLHPTFWVPIPEAAKIAKAAGATDLLPEVTDALIRLEAALDESVESALRLGGTITGEHGVGQYKLRWLPLEQHADVLALQRSIKAVFDPTGILNPGKAIC